LPTNDLAILQTLLRYLRPVKASLIRVANFLSCSLRRFSAALRPAVLFQAITRKPGISARRVTGDCALLTYGGVVVCGDFNHVSTGITLMRRGQFVSGCSEAAAADHWARALHHDRIARFTVDPQRSPPNALADLSPAMDWQGGG
jgi:hypothetical protein